jgi:hypothetical protein
VTFFWIASLAMMPRAQVTVLSILAAAREKSMLMADNTAQTALMREISPAERLLWSGMPRQGIRFRGGDLFAIPFSLLWGGFAIFWEYNVVISNKAPFFFVLWGVPFVLVGIYIIAGRFFFDSYRRSQTYYAVTDQRLLILSGIWSREVKALSLQNLNEISLTERSDGGGDIAFGSINSMYAMWRGPGWPGMDNRMVPTFELLDDVRQVYDLIKQTQRKK